MTLAFNADATPDTTKLEWATLNPDSLPPGIRKLYDAYKAQYVIAADARRAFEAAFKTAVVAPTGTEARFGYLYGKLSYAFAPIKVTRTSAKLVDFAKLARR